MFVVAAAVVPLVVVVVVVVVGVCLNSISLLVAAVGHDETESR